MTWRSDSSQLFAGKWTSSLYAGLGIQAQNVPATGSNGAGYLYNDIAEYSFAATDELRGQILTLPAAGTFTPYEDSSFSFTGAPDGIYTFTYRGFRNGVSYGDYTATLNIGTAATESTISYDIGAVTFAAELTVSVPTVELTASYDIGSVEWLVSANVAYAGNALSVSYDIGAVAYSVLATATPLDNLINISYDIGAVAFATSMNVIAAPSDIGLTVNYDIGAISYNVAIISGSGESLYGIGSGVIFVEPPSGVLFSN